MIRGGENVYCAEVEAALYEHPAMHEAAVYGLPDERLGEVVAATVLLRAGTTVTAAELQAFVGERLAGVQGAERIDFATEQLPRNAAGKILKRELRDQRRAERVARLSSAAATGSWGDRSARS